ncbi:CBS domain-containing protein [Novisyntrophococcus fermenticellae]|uniref:CBS domain-containing protein n=1 Tax=Novisyntrophococcus fermenticellae TaxID=2068655 RepID=UPI001E4DBE4E|nr:CBS domain-containing protein [Novisyntrophococcus fermenticellae]
MNILFFITPKSEVAYINEEFTLRQTIEKMEFHRYTAIPLLNHRGMYIGTITEGDILRCIKERCDLNLHDAEDIPIVEVKRRWHYESVNINCNIEDLVTVSMKQNFVPVVDDEGVFIGIIRRKDIIQYCYEKSGLKDAERKKSREIVNV